MRAGAGQALLHQAEGQFPSSSLYSSGKFSVADEVPKLKGFRIDFFFGPLIVIHTNIKTGFHPE